MSWATRITKTNIEHTGLRYTDRTDPLRPLPNPEEFAPLKRAHVCISEALIGTTPPRHGFDETQKDRRIINLDSRMQEGLA
jgi:hypothetical protein